MTLPAIVKNYKKQQTASQVKIIYSLLNQAIINSIAENGDIDNWDFSLLYNRFADKYIIPYLNVSKICDGANCIQSKMEDGRYFHGYYELNKTKHTGIEYSFVLANGMIVMLNTTTLNLVIFTVDINGNQGENMLGRDVFAFYLLNHTDTGALPFTKNYKAGLYPGGTSASGIPHIALSKDDLFDANTHRACSKKKTVVGGHGGVGTACAAVIVKDGWTISKDYPW